jgi:HSP20 family protein
MAIVRWEPFRDLVSIQDRMNRIFDDAFRGSRTGAEDDWALGGTWAPAVDIFEKDGTIVLKATCAWRTTCSRCAASASSSRR